MKQKSRISSITISILSTLFTLLICEVLLALFYPQPLSPVRSQFDPELLEIYKPLQKVDKPEHPMPPKPLQDVPLNRRMMCHFKDK